MSARVPIEPSEIRAGDLIRFEYADGACGSDRAREYVAGDNGTGDGRGPAGTYYLLDRPTPAVDLPTEPMLGWATVLDPSVGGTRGVRLGIWVSVDTLGRSVKVAPDRLLQRSKELGADHVTAFTPAVAVPKAALDEFRRVFENAEESGAAQINAGDRFLRSVDKAAQS